MKNITHIKGRYALTQALLSLLFCRLDGFLHLSLLSYILMLLYIWSQKLFVSSIPCLHLTALMISLRRSVTCLAIFCNYSHGYCSSELANCVSASFPPTLVLLPLRTEYSTYSQLCSVCHNNAIVNQRLHSFIILRQALLYSSYIIMYLYF